MAGDLFDDYARAGFSGRLHFGERPALLHVDIVQAYLQPGSPLYAPPFEDALQTSLRLNIAARAAGIPVLFTNVLFDAEGRNGGLFFRKVPALRCFLPGSPLAAFPERLKPVEGDVVVTKQYASAFFGTPLASTLTSMRIDTLLITGFSTSGCVRATALDALQHGFAPFVIAGACGDRDVRPHETNLFDLQAKYAEVISEDQALGLIGGLGAPG